MADVGVPVKRGGWWKWEQIQEMLDKAVDKAVADERERIAQAIEVDANGPRPGSINHRAYAGHFAEIARATPKESE